MRGILIISLLLTSVCWVGAQVPDNAQTTPAFTPASTVVIPGGRETVQRVPQLRPLTAAEKAAIQTYLEKHGGTGECQNQRALRAALEFLTGIDQSHFPLSRQPAQYLADYQTFTQMFNRVDCYVNVPDRLIQLPLPPALPEFVPAGPAAPIVGIRLEAIPPPSCSASAIAIAVAIIEAPPAVPLAFPKSGLYGQLPYTTTGVGTAAYISAWRQTGRTTSPPPPGPCPGPPNPPPDPPVPL